jgi:hypothetical protein
MNKSGEGYKFKGGPDNDNWQHGMYGTPEYISWRKMKERCLNPNAHNYIYYGGRGITIDPRWLKFENFYADMGPKPDPKYTLERINSNGNYEPNNVIWASFKIQRHNRRK